MTHPIVVDAHRMKRILPLTAALILIVAVGIVRGGFGWRRGDDAPALQPTKNTSVAAVSSSISAPAGTVFVFFGNTARDPHTLHCAQTYPVTRIFGQRKDIERFALEELLRGPTEEEIGAGYYTAIPESLAVSAMTLEHGVATVTFSSTSDGVDGMCRSQTFRSQITMTLRQFSSIRDIVFNMGAGKSSASTQG